tara:strand:+ start:1199 stop:1429 length:231 start_codon:yes stop_codon:yes gene_type:complete
VSSNKDTQVAAVVDKYLHREEVGFKKYNTNLDRTDLTLDEWLTHLQEELMDATVYIEKLKTELGHRQLLGLLKESK